MPSKRTRTVRGRRAASLTPAELEWLTGEPRPGANPFWDIRTGASFGGAEPSHMDELDRLLDRAVGVVSGERIAELRALIARRRAEHREKYPLHPAYAT